MKVLRINALLAAALMVVAFEAAAGPPRPIAGTEYGEALFGTGALEAVSAPAAIPDEIRADVDRYGPAGVVTGVVSGGVKGAGHAVRGGARMLIGLLDAITAPFADPR